VPAAPGNGGIMPAPVTSNIAVDPVDPSRVFVATSRGLYFSSQGGQSWGLRDLGLTSADSGTVYATSVIACPIDRTLLYATTGRPMGLFKSTDNGNTWQALNPSYPGEPPPPPFPFSPMVVALGPNGSDLYVVDTNTNFFKSVDNGATWQLLAQGLYGTQAVIFDPVNPNNIYVLDSLGLQKSVDGGLHFGTLAASLPGITPDRVQQIAVDASGTLYVGSNSATYVSTDGGSTLTMVASTPSLHSLVTLGDRVYGGFDTPAEAFVVKWDPTGTRMLYSTFVGGDRTSISGLKADAQGNVTLTGTTYSSDFPVTKRLGSTSPTGAPSAFVTRLSPDGTKLIYSTVVGGSKGVLATGLTLDSSGAAFVVGQTQSADFPTTPNAVQPTVPTTSCTRPQNGFFVFPNTGIHTFVIKMSANGTGFDYATFLTGSCGSAGQGIVVDSTGQVMVSGSTTSPDFPVSANAYQGAFPGPPELTLATERV